MNPFKLVSAIMWLALAIGVGDSLVDVTRAMRGAAISAHQKGPMNYTKFTAQLTGR